MFQVNQFIFDHRAGEINLPTRSTRVYASPANPYIGAQVLPPQSTPSVLTLKRYDIRSAAAYNRDLQLATIGQVVSIADSGIQYHRAPYFLNWFVADVEILVFDVIPAASGYRNGFAFNYFPASRVVSKWTVYPIPIT